MQRKLERDYRRRLREGTLRDGYGMAGCGLGAEIFGPRTGGVQILAATTNGSSGNQTFAISSGTSECTGNRKERWLSAYLMANGPKVRTQSVRKEGEAWKILPQVAGCTPAEAALTVLDGKWEGIFSVSDTDQQAKTILRILRDSGEVHCAG